MRILTPPSGIGRGDIDGIRNAVVPGPVHRSRSDNAVLVPLVVGPWTGSLVTRRAKKLPARAGEIILPGGRMDPSDASWGLTGATVADLRERA